MTTTEAAKHWINGHVGAWSTLDASLAADLFAEKCVYTWHPFNSARVGRQSIAEYIQWAFTAQTDVEISFGIPVVGDGTMAVEYRMNYAQVSDLRRFTIAGSQMVTFDDQSRAVSVRDYWHVAKEPVALSGYA